MVKITHTQTFLAVRLCRASQVQEVLENWQDFANHCSLKPLERKRAFDDDWDKFLVSLLCIYIYILLYTYCYIRLSLGHAEQCFEGDEMLEGNANSEKEGEGEREREIPIDGFGPNSMCSTPQIGIQIGSKR